MVNGGSNSDSLKRAAQTGRFLSVTSPTVMLNVLNLAAVSRQTNGVVVREQALEVRGRGFAAGWVRCQMFTYCWPSEGLLFRSSVDINNDRYCVLLYVIRLHVTRRGFSSVR